MAPDTMTLARELVERAYHQMIHAASAFKSAKPVRDELRAALSLPPNSTSVVPAESIHEIAPPSSSMTKVSYPKGDLRRMLSVLAAIDAIPNATLVKIVERTGIDKKTVTNLITQAGEQAGVLISKTGPVYTLDDWGPIIKRAGAKMVLAGASVVPVVPA